ncbi:SCA7-domain-containing protein [Piromyces finnis]|uniref:SCA7-domain-containing protein n=1 Tax=Piromyces finnis TaxID=1754191 RepID=A0A1Y1UZM9_9FUNG|nr:SCA7-domain-containing protein [Piromyces finnis]|eukprot:ORX43273.1 SCA7-domain-containing protein [Piromyces finnis]
MGKHSHDIPWKKYKEILEFEEPPEKQYIKDKTKSELEYSVLLEDNKKIFNIPIEDEFIVVSCNTCKKPVLQSALLYHLENCKKIKKIQEESGPLKKDIQLSVFYASKPLPVVKPKKNKKRKLTEDGQIIEKESKNKENETVKEKKKAKDNDNAKKSTKKKKGPIDLDKQCGVMTENGTVCTRSLTCKIHSVSAKRAVQGRSQDYDTLYRATSRLKEMAANQLANSMAKQKKDAKAAATRKALKDAAEAAANAATLAAGIPIPTNSDEEAEVVYTAVKYHQPTPLYMKNPFSLRRRIAMFQYREEFCS